MLTRRCQDYPQIRARVLAQFKKNREVNRRLSILFVKRVQSLNLPKFLCLKATQEHLSFMNTLTLKSLGKAIFQLIVILTPIFMNCSSHGSAIPAEFLIF